jgi:hypothetical protein
MNYGNLMFPRFALTRSLELSASQRALLRGSPFPYE